MIANWKLIGVGVGGLSAVGFVLWRMSEQRKLKAILMVDDRTKILGSADELVEQHLPILGLGTADQAYEHIELLLPKQSLLEKLHDGLGLPIQSGEDLQSAAEKLLAIFP